MYGRSLISQSILYIYSRGHRNPSSKYSSTETIGQIFSRLERKIERSLVLTARLFRTMVVVSTADSYGVLGEMGPMELGVRSVFPSAPYGLHDDTIPMQTLNESTRMELLKCTL